MVLMALGAFVAAEWAEGKFGGKKPDADSLLAPARRFTPVRRFALVLAAGGLVATFAGSPCRGPFARVDARQVALDIANGTDRVSVDTLVEQLVAGRNDFLLVDVREPAAFARYHLPGATNVPLASIAGASPGQQERLICYGEQDREAMVAVLQLRSLGHSASYALSGGLAAWQAHVLFPKALPPDAPPAAQHDHARRVAMARFFGGSAQVGGGAASPHAPALPVMVPASAEPGGARPVTARKKKEGC